MSTRDLLLIDLYHTIQNPQQHALAARYAPTLDFDANEPFLPLAAGYTLFTTDGPSASFQRIIQLCPPGKPPAAQAIEYAIWWDWDIHHLYELEHVWIYVDDAGEISRVEGSWHGDYHEIPVQLVDGHAILYSEAGKHAFAPSPEWFRKRAKETRRVETWFTGLHAGVLINDMFRGKIRQRVFDRTVARSFLATQAFEPSWDYTQRFSFRADWLVPWSALEDWIPVRVNAWLARLDQTLLPVSYRALRVAYSEGTLAGLQSVAHAGADAVMLAISSTSAALVTGSTPDALDMQTLFDFCSQEPLGAFLEPDTPQTVALLAEFVQKHDLRDYVVVSSAAEELLWQYQSLVPGGATVFQFPEDGQDPLAAANRAAAQYIHLPKRMLTPEWIERLHAGGVGVLGGPTATRDAADDLQRRGVDIVWLDVPSR